MGGYGGCAPCQRNHAPSTGAGGVWTMAPNLAYETRIDEGDEGMSFGKGQVETRTRRVRVGFWLGVTTSCRCHTGTNISFPALGCYQKAVRVWRLHASIKLFAWKIISHHSPHRPPGPRRGSGDAKRSPNKELNDAPPTRHLSHWGVFTSRLRAYSASYRLY